MTATSVASSSQMASATLFGQATQSKSPAFNPFASNSLGNGSAFGLGGAGDSSKSKKNKRNGNNSDSEVKKPFNPFKDANVSDSGKQKFQGGDDRKKKGAMAKKNNHTNGDAKKSKPQDSRDGNAFNPFATQPSQNSDSRPSEDEDDDSSRFRVPAINTNDPHARKVYEQLRKDGISPPSWPSQPGNPAKKAQMSKFREQYEAYRGKVRASLTKAGLIDDPEKRKTLQDAIDFKGICEDMCPEFEKITRITEVDVNHPEKNPKTAFPNTRRMVKKLARSAAGQEAPLPMDVRSIPALKRSLDYLIDGLLRNDGNLPTLHGFLWDRTRAIRRDFTFFSSLTPEEMKIQVNVLEHITRFHVTALHLLSQEGKAGEDFVEQQELEQLGKTLLSLRDCYDDCNEQGITCENEAEFRAYYLIFHAYDSNIIETLQRQWRSSLWRDSDEVRTAVSLVEALQNTEDFHGPLKDAPSLAASAAYNSYFRIVENPEVSYTMACFAECHFPHIRRSILIAIKKALARPRETTKDVTAAVLNKFLRFDTIEEAIEFAELHDFEFGLSQDDPMNSSLKYLILDNRKRLPHHRLQHQFSQSLVEKKRGSRSLPDLIHESVREDLNAPKPVVNGAGEESLFVSDTDTTTQPSIPTGPKAMTPANPFPTFSQPSGGTTTTIKPGTTPIGILSSSSSALQQFTPTANPFAPTEAKNPPVNPFASAQPSSAPSFFTSGVAPLIPPVQSGTSGASGWSMLTKHNGLNSDPVAPAEGSGTKNQEPLNALVPSPFFQPQMTSLTETSSNKEKELKAQALKPLAPVNTGPDTTKAPAINIVPPTSQPTPSPFSMPPLQATPSPFAIPPTAPSSVSSILGGSSSQPESTQPSLGASFKVPATAPARPGEQPVKSVAFPPPAALPKFNSAPTPTASLQPSSTPSLPAPSKEATTKPFELPKAPISPPKSPSPPRDLLGDFTKWFVKGDNGLLEDFQAFMLDDILQSVFTTFEMEEAEKRRKEEEERAIEKADAFRVYSLSVKYFYQWRNHARDMRLSELRRSGRAQMISYYKAQREADRKAQKQAARQAAREKAEIELLNRPEELRDFMKRKVSKRQAEDDLLASGVLSGLNNEQEAIARIVRKAPSSNGSTTSTQSRLSQSTNRGGPKTQALRERLLRDRSASFRRSLPPMSSRETASPSSGSHSRASERWRLKAMDIVQMPDGTALPESLANEIRYGKKSFSRIGSMGPPNGIPSRRASIEELGQPKRQRTFSASESHIDTATQNKRKRPTEDDGEANKDKSNPHAHKRVMSDAANLINELRAMREEMEEGATWFKEQNERLQSELTSRGSTPWDQEI
ncbi:Fc.00g051880.m01.CDS01 [Cosmosporella sp. VM-42]